MSPSIISSDFVLKEVSCGCPRRPLTARDVSHRSVTVVASTFHRVEAPVPSKRNPRNGHCRVQGGAIIAIDASGVVPSNSLDRSIS